MTTEEIIKKYHIGKDSRVKFKNDGLTYYVKNIHPDRKSLFVTINGNQIHKKNIKNLVKVDNKDIVNEGIKYKIKELLTEYVADLNLPVSPTFYNLRSMLDVNRRGDNVKIGPNTYLHWVNNGEDIAVKYHHTDIATFDILGNIRLNTDGYWTVTTIGRLNQIIPGPISIFTRKGDLYIKGSNGLFKFKDHMIVNKNGDIIF